MAHIPFLSHYLERKNIEYQNQLLARQVEEVQNIYLTMRGWRHDYHNHLQSMKAYVEMGQYDKLQEYLGLLENDLDQVNQLCDSGNVNLDAILNSKISLAEKNGIRVDYKAACPANLTVSDIDLCALIGNLIDNAVEACEGLADPYIRLYIGVLKNQLYISVTNATKDLAAKTDVGTLTTLTTTAKNNLVAAINEIDEHQDSTASIVGGQAEIIDGLDARIGALTDLNTTAKGTLVAAINEVKASADGKMTSSQVDSKITAAKVGLATETYVNNKVSSVYKYKGSKDTYGSLPTTGNAVGDVWNVVDKNGQNFAWTGSAWDALGETIDLSGYMKNDALQEITATEVEALFK